jgi:hypothetical protein
LVAVQREVQQGVFIIICLRCRPTGLTQGEQRDIVTTLQASKYGNKIRDFLKARRRRPLSTEFPIVGGSDLQDINQLMKDVCVRVEEITMGAPIGYLVSVHSTCLSLPLIL